MKKIDCLGKILFLSNLEIGSKRNPTESIRRCSRILHEVVRDSVKSVIITGKLIGDKVLNKETVVISFCRVLVGLGIPVYITSSPDSHFLNKLEWSKSCVTEVSEQIINIDTSKYSEQHPNVLFTMGKSINPTPTDNIVDSCTTQIRELCSRSSFGKQPWIFFGFADMSFISSTFSFACCGRFSVDDNAHQYITVTPGPSLTIETKRIFA